MSKYLDKTNKDKVFITLDKSVNLNENQITRVSKKLIMNGHLGRKLNKLDNAKLITAEKRTKVLKNAKENGFFMLNGFADCYRKSIKISYPTLYRRLHKNKDIQKTLIERDIIQIYQTKKKVDLKTMKSTTTYVKIRVNYNKKAEFIKFIRTYFVNEMQLSEKIC